MRRMNSTTQVRECILLRQIIQQVHLDKEREDNSAYLVHFLGSIQDDRFGYIWKGKVENKCNFFDWLMVERKILTSDKL